MKRYNNKHNEKIKNFHYIGRYFFISNELTYESFITFSNYMFEIKTYNTKILIFNIITKKESDIIIENHYIREKQDLNKKLENKLPIKRDKIKCKKI